MNLSPAEAEAEVRDMDAEYRERIVNGPADQVSWQQLSRLADQDTEAALAVWERIKREAYDELVSGHRTAKVLEWQGSPWQRAQFLALRASFMAEWQPRGGIEQALIDQMAHAYTEYLLWTEVHHQRLNSAVIRERLDLERRGKRDLPNMSNEQAIEHAALMADRFNRLLLRTLRALRDLPRYSPAVIVQNNGGQVTVATHQVNVAGG